MPDTFDGFPVAGWTRHFCVTYADGDPDALARAQAIASICESDLSKLQLWFDCNYDSSPYSVWVHVEPGVHRGGADNYGYEDDESSRILVTGTFRPTAPAFNVNPIRDDYACMLFAAELTEILADFSGRGGGKVWDRSTSSGEALSRVAAAELHPFGYYASGAGPVINNWLKSSASAVGEPFRRWDFVTTYERTDDNDLSYGCGILFLNYLRYQRGYSFPQIVQASGSSLAETFSRLTSQPASDAFDSFDALLGKHFVFPMYAYAPTDNVFPLYDNPSVGLLVNSESLPPQPTWNQRVPVLRFGAHHITLKAGPLCQEKDYTYWIENIPVHYTVQAVTRGFARADFAWSVGGTPLPVIGLSEEAIANVEIMHTTPGPAAPATASLPIRYAIQLGNNTSTLQFWNESFPGNGYIDISVVATESNVPTIQAAVTENWPLNMLQFDMDDQWKADFRNCQLPTLLDMANSIQKLGRRIFLLKTQPDPPPDQLVALAIDAERFSKNLQEITGGSTGLQTAAAAIAASMSSPEAEFSVEAPALPGGRPTRTLNRPGPQPQPGAAPNSRRPGGAGRP